MAILKDSVFTLWNTIKKSALGISDQSVNGFEGFYVSFLPTGRPIDKDDYYKPKTMGGVVDGDNADRLRKVCELVDKQLEYKADGTCNSTNNFLSQSYRLIIGQATSTGLPPLNDIELQQQIDKAYELLYVNYPESSEKTKIYQQYKDSEKEWQQAIRAYADAYQKTRINPEAEANWDQVGLTYIQDITDSLNDFSVNKDKVENALALIGSQTKDTAAELLMLGKQDVDINTGRYLIDVGGATKALYSEISPTSWCDPEAENWTGYYFNSATSHMSSNTETSSYGGGGGVSFGFWSIGGEDQHSETRTELNIENDNLFISFEYSIVDINRPWFDTLIFKLRNWKIPGIPKGTISNGGTDQILQAIKDQDSLWLPAFPSQIILVKNLFISNSQFMEAYNASQSYTKAGASFGWGPFSISGSYSKQSSNVVVDTYQGFDGLRVKGVQIIGWISEITPFSPKIDG